MPLFHYKALKQNGEVVEADIEAADKTAVFNIVNTGGTSLVFAEPLESKRSFWEKANQIFATVKTQEKIMFARNLSAMIQAGLSVGRALSVMERQTKNQFFKKILVMLQDDIKKGQPLSAALEVHKNIWENLFISMVRAGEESGDLSKSLREIATQMEKSYLLKKKITGAMMYPGIIMGVMLIIGVLMLIYVVPTLTSTFKELNVELPISTQAIIWASDFMKENTIIFLLTLAVLGVGIYFGIRSRRGKLFIDMFAPKLPLVGNLVKENYSAKTARTLSSLLISGVEVVSAISITKDVVGNIFYRKVLDEASAGIQKGVQISEAFEKHENLYPVFVAEMTSVGEETGKLAEMLERVASYYENEIEQQTKNLSTIIEPVLMVVIGAVVGFFAVSMIMPMYSLVNGL